MLAGLALAWTLLNAVKPLTVDDCAYCYFARHIAAAPLDPYGFTYAGCKPALHTMAPPLLPYWWAAALRLFGERPFLWKLALLPFCLLLLVALHELLRRFAHGLELPLLVFLAGSPVFLPAWNLMLDLPALALGLGGLVLYLRAADGKPTAAERRGTFADRRGAAGYIGRPPRSGGLHCPPAAERRATFAYRGAAPQWSRLRRGSSL